MELIAISDIYGSVRIVEELLSKLDASKVNKRIVVAAGDLGIKASRDYHKDVSRILTLLAKSCRYLLYVPGDSDSGNLDVEGENVVNLDRRPFVIKEGDFKLGFMGLGGAPKDSVRPREPLTYIWNERIPVVYDKIKMELKIRLEKLWLDKPDEIILVTHSPPHSIADRSSPITLRETVLMQEIAEEALAGKSDLKESEKKKAYGPRMLGSRAIKEFVRIFKPDIHIFGHVHKEGGKIVKGEDTLFINISHLSPQPYKLTGRRFLRAEIAKEWEKIEFKGVVNKSMSFRDFVETYL